MVPNYFLTVCLKVFWIGINFRKYWHKFSHGLIILTTTPFMLSHLVSTWRKAYCTEMLVIFSISLNSSLHPLESLKKKWILQKNSSKLKSKVVIAFQRLLCTICNGHIPTFMNDLFISLCNFSENFFFKSFVNQWSIHTKLKQITIMPFHFLVYKVLK